MANHYRFRQLLPAEELRLTWILCSDPEIKEQKLIRAYFWEFGETPLFNRAFRTHDKMGDLLCEPPPPLKA